MDVGGNLLNHIMWFLIKAGNEPIHMVNLVKFIGLNVRLNDDHQILKHQLSQCSHEVIPSPF